MSKVKKVRVPSHYVRYRDTTRQVFFTLALSKSAVEALAHYVKYATAPDCGRQIKACNKLFEAGFLNATKRRTPVGDQIYKISDIGQRVHRAMVLAKKAAKLGAKLSASGVVDQYTRFATTSRGDGFFMQLFRSSVIALQHYREQPSEMLNCRRHRDGARRLRLLGLLNVKDEPDSFGRDAYVISDVGKVFYDVLVFSGHIVPE
jgi:hypothetical protein